MKCSLCLFALLFACLFSCSVSVNAQVVTPELAVAATDLVRLHRAELASDGQIDFAKLRREIEQSAYTEFKGAYLSTNPRPAKNDDSLWANPWFRLGKGLGRAALIGGKYVATQRGIRYGRREKAPLTANADGSLNKGAFYGFNGAVFVISEVVLPKLAGHKIASIFSLMLMGGDAIVTVHDWQSGTQAKQEFNARAGCPVDKFIDLGNGVTGCFH